MTVKSDTRAKRLGLTTHALTGFQFLDIDESGYAKELGSGGSGIVFKASQTIAKSVTLDRAIKFFLYRDDIANLTRNKNKSPISLEDFQAEVFNITSFNHQHLVKVIDASLYECQEGDVPYIITDYISGPTMRQLIEEPENPLCYEIVSYIEDNPEEVLEILAKIGEAVKHIFDRGFSHCDIAPKNIFIQNIGNNFEPILGDLGISKSLNPDRTARRTVFIAGSRKWMPDHVAEHIESEVPYETFVSFQPDWDIYAFCKTGLELIRSFYAPHHQYWFKAVDKALRKGLEAGAYRNISQVVERIEFLKPIHREVARIPELSNGIGMGNRMMMPVEALKATDRLNDLIKHPAVFRLSSVPQLTTSNYILAGSGHTRYEHTLGALETMRRYILSLLDEREFLEYFSVEKIETALVSAALSSVTRFPLSNVIHEMRGRDKSQFKNLSRTPLFREIMSIPNKNGDTLEDIIARDFRGPNPDNIYRVVKKHDDHPDEADSLINSMLNCSIDVRVLDFIRRDAHHLGIISADSFDLDEILTHLTVYDNKLAIRETGISVVEHIISLRYWLFNRAYWNRPNRAFFAMTRYVLSRLHETKGDQSVNSSVLYKNQKEVLLDIYHESRKAGLNDCISIMDKLLANENNIYKLTYETNLYYGPGKLIEWAKESHFSKLDETINTLSSEFRGFCETWPNDDGPPLLIDFPTEPGSKKLGEDIIVVSDRFQPTRLTDYSQIVAGTANSFTCQLSKFRIYRHPAVKIPKQKRDQAEKFLENRLLELID